MKHDIICIILVKEQCCGERGAVLKGMTHKLFGRLWLEDTLGERVYIHVDTELRSCSNLRPHALYQPLWSGMISCAKFLWQMPKPFLLNWPTNSWFWLLSLGNTPTLILARNLCCMSSCSCFLIIPSVTVASRFQCGENICEFKKKTNKKTKKHLICCIKEILCCSVLLRTAHFIGKEEVDIKLMWVKNIHFTRPLSASTALYPRIRRHHRSPADPGRAALHKGQQRRQKPAHLHHILRVGVMHTAADHCRFQVTTPWFCPPVNHEVPCHIEILT